MVSSLSLSLAVLFYSYKAACPPAPLSAALASRDDRERECEPPLPQCEPCGHGRGDTEGHCACGRGRRCCQKGAVAMGRYGSDAATAPEVLQSHQVELLERLELWLQALDARLLENQRNAQAGTPEPHTRGGALGFPSALLVLSVSSPWRCTRCACRRMRRCRRRSWGYRRRSWGGSPRSPRREAFWGSGAAPRLHVSSTPRA